MKKTTTQNTQNTPFSKNGLKWDTNEIFEANLMFPTVHFESEICTRQMSSKNFCELIEEMLTPCQPLSPESRKALAESVNSGNRLRVYYQATVLLERHIEAIKDTQSNDSDINDFINQGDKSVIDKIGTKIKDTETFMLDESIAVNLHDEVHKKTNQRED